jgi:integrase
MRRVEHPNPYRPKPVNAANDTELRALLRALDASQIDDATRCAIELQLLTGARPTEVRLATWTEFDFARAIWVLPGARVKSGREFRVHLSEEALAVLQRAKRIKRESKKSTFVFPGVRGGPMEKMAVARALSRLTDRIAKEGGKKLTPHDLRRTFRTMLSRLGVLPHVAELCMNHQERETMRRVYDGHDYFSEMANTWDRAGAHLAALEKGGATVTSINAAKVA